MSRSRRGGSNAGKSSPSKPEMQQCDAFTDMIHNLDAKMDKMDVAFQLLRTEVSEMRAEISTYKDIKTSLDFTDMSVQEIKKDMTKLNKVSKASEESRRANSTVIRV